VANGAAAAGLVGDAVDAWGVDLPTPLRELLETIGSAKG
jgi:hypothetical protein